MSEQKRLPEGFRPEEEEEKEEEKEEKEEEKEGCDFTRERRTRRRSDPDEFQENERQMDRDEVRNLPES